MVATQEFQKLESKELLIAEVDRLHKHGYRLAQASITKKDNYDILYSFEKNGKLMNLRLVAEDGESIASISGIYPYAFIYENEMRDLFGIHIKYVNIEFAGGLYKTSVKTPFLNGKE